MPFKSGSLMSEKAVFRVTELSERGDTPFRLEPDADARAALAGDLGLLGLRKLRFDGVIAPDGPTGWRVEGMLGATVVQPCSVTLEPVSTRIDEPVLRRFLPGLQDAPEGDEIEMPEDDSLEPLGTAIDLDAILREALALSLPAFPRKPDAELDKARFAPPGVTPLADTDLKPFAGLQALRDQLRDAEDE